ncbi:MAG: TfoX/Sxy family protein [Pseudomonadota bacterium]
MDIEATVELFEPVLAVSARKMFGGLGVYAGDRIIAIVAYGEVYLKGDDENEDAYRAVGMAPFVYDGGAKPITMRYWRLPAVAYDDEEELARLTHLALGAADRAGPPKRRKPRRKGREPQEN